MKKVKIVIIVILVILVVILAGIGIVKLKDYLELRNEISNLDFTMQEYKTIGDVIYYTGELTEEETNALLHIADLVKEQYPEKTIVLTEIRDGVSYMNTSGTYLFNQIVNGQVIDDTDITIVVSEDNTISGSTMMFNDWSEGNNVDDVEIDQEEAEQILKEYFLENTSEYEEFISGMPLGVTSNSNLTRGNIIEFYQYKEKPSWKMRSDTGNYIIIDANTGEILDKYIAYNGPIY